MHTVQQLKSEIVSACKILSKQKLVEGFGHVSARIPDSDRFLLTPRISLALVKEEDLLTLNLAGEVVGGNYPAPFESWLHVAIMKSQPRVGAITRIHARVDNIYPSGDRVPAALYKLGLTQENLAQRDAARRTMQDLVKRFPQSGEAQLARALLASPRRR